MIISENIERLKEYLDYDDLEVVFDCNGSLFNELEIEIIDNRLVVTIFNTMDLEYDD